MSQDQARPEQETAGSRTEASDRSLDAPHRGDAEDAVQEAVGLLRTTGRIALGGAVVGAEIVMERLRTWEREAATAPSTPEATRAAEAAVSLTDALLGLSARLGARAEQFAGLAWDAGGLGARVGKGLLGAVRWATPSSVTDPIEGAIGGLRRRLEGLSTVGRDEVLRARALFQAVASDAWERGVSRFAHDREVARLVRTQSQGVAASIVDDVRGGAGRVDDVLEGVVGRLLGRARRAPAATTPSPVPVDGSTPGPVDGSPAGAEPEALPGREPEAETRS